jgi:hypothetical protein
MLDLRYAALARSKPFAWAGGEVRPGGTGGTGGIVCNVGGRGDETTRRGLGTGSLLGGFDESTVAVEAVDEAPGLDARLLPPNTLYSELSRFVALCFTAALMLGELAGPGSVTIRGEAFHGGRAAALVDASDIELMADEDGRRLSGRFALSGVREDGTLP